MTHPPIYLICYKATGTPQSLSGVYGLRTDFQLEEEEARTICKKIGPDFEVVRYVPDILQEEK
ncbi:hypothetical protein KGP36_01855 [Patescibacteria group bacterium]|nr:hypothetical protein [Patescibacteria group bacterium]